MALKSKTQSLYSRSSTTHTFNLLLNGRWHTGTTPDISGQIEIQEMIVKMSGMNHNSIVLDFGCGNGLVSADYYHMTGATVYGVSDQPDHILTARQLAISQNTTGKFDVCINELLPYPDDSFDIVVFTESPCHIKDKRALFREFNRVLKPYGTIVGEDWAHIHPNGSSAQRINNGFGTHMVAPYDYIKLGDIIGMTTQIKQIKPSWKISPVGSIMKWIKYKIKYPTLSLESPFQTKESQINKKLVDAGKHLETSSGFKLVIVKMITKSKR